MRLTYRDSTVPHTNAKGELWEAYSDRNYNEVINKLAAYEDTGFEPDEIDFCLSGVISPQEAKERYEAHKKRYDEWLAWKQAEDQGLLVRLPCKVGDTVYRVVRRRVDVSGYRMEWEWETAVEAVKFRIGMTDSVGKTVFLTRAEAENALRKGGGET